MTKAALADGNRSIEQPQLFCWGTNLERKLQLGWRTLARIPSFELALSVVGFHVGCYR